ncbi:MAG TPA: ABC transporter substrate-binding protein [Acidimicrobiales bacterium]|nr:ABC transporter substrate-binding protein [Acidimicrobiales bacterium]
MWTTVGKRCVLMLAVALGGTTLATASAGASSATPPQSYGSLPAEHGTPTKGGVVSIAEPPSAGPTYIFPITPGANLSVYDVDQFQDYMWRPLWFSPKGAEPTIDYTDSISPHAPTYSNDNKTVTITLRPNWKWSDGTPVTSTDLVFYIDLLKAAVAISPANDGDYTPGLFPDNLVSMSTPNTTTLVLNFSATYNQNFIFLDQLGGMEPLPAQAWAETSASGPIVDFTDPANAKAIYTFLNAQSNDLSTYGTNPLWQVVDGPFKISSFDPATDGNTLVANHAFSGPSKPKIAGIDNVAFTSTSAEFNQLLTGKLTIGGVDASDLPQVPKLEKEGYDVWGYPNLGFDYITYNFKDKTGEFDKIISQLYFRQALAHLQNEPGIIKSKGGYGGAAGQAYGPVPAVPPTPFTPSNATTNPYPYSVSAASKLLSSHGWDVKAGGTTTCQKPGTSSSECGAGISKGTPLTFNIVYVADPQIGATEVEQFASAGKEIGITMKLQTKTFNYIESNLSDVSNPNNDNSWAMQEFGGFTDDLYPTTNEIFNTTGSFNGGGFSNPTIDADINASANSLNAKAVEKELSDITRLQPGLFQAEPDLIVAFKKDLSGPPSSFAALSQYQPEPEYWYFTK